MIPSLSPLLILLCVPFLALGAIIVGFPALRTAGVASAFNSVLAFSLCVVMARHPTNMLLLEWDRPWSFVPGWPSIHCHLAITGFSSLLLMVVSLIGFTAIAKIPEKTERPGLFAGMLLTLNGAAVGALLSQDVFEQIFYLSLLVMPPFLLIGKWGGHNRQLGGFQTTLTWCIAIGLIFVGFLGLATLVPNSFLSYEWGFIRDSASNLPIQKQTILFGIILAGTGLLIGAVPLHGWILAGYSAAPVSAAIFMAGVIPCIAFRLLIDWGIHLLPAGYGQCQPWLMAMGVTNLIYAGILTWELREIRQVMGAVCLCQRGLVFLGLAISNPVAQEGAFLLMIGAALSGACSVGLMAELELRAGDNRIRELAHKSFSLDTLHGLSFLGASGAAVGFPLSINFIGLFLVLQGIVQTSGPILLLATLIGLALFGSGLIQTIWVLYFRNSSPSALSTDLDEPSHPHKTPLSQPARDFIPYGLLLLLNLIGGCDPSLFLRMLDWGRLPTP